VIAPVLDRHAPHPCPSPPDESVSGSAARIRGEKGEGISVAFVIDNLSRAGTESQLLALIRSLDRSVITPSLVLLDGDNSLSQSLEPTDCDILRLGVSRLVSPSTVKAAWRLKRHWQRNKPDIVVAYFLDSAYFALPIAKLVGAKTVRVRNNLGYWQTRKHRWLGRAMRPFTDSVLTNSDEGRAALASEGHKQIEVIGNGVDLERFPNPAPVNVTKSKVRIGCVANLRPVKNIDGLLRVARTISNRFPHIEFTVAGDGEQRPELERLVGALGLTNRFHLLGSVANVPEFLASCELAVLPSHSEGMSNALLEYLAAGRAIVATDVGANRRVLGEAGIIVSVNDKAIAAAIMELLSHRHQAEEFGQLARERAEGEYSRAAMVARFEEFFQMLAGRASDGFRSVARASG
jgi:glycosyltransferase involved in cell wall biosynthesis